MTRSHSFLTILLVATAFSACECDPVAPPPGDVCGSGAVDGVGHALVADKSRLVITVKRASPDGPCGIFHSHVVNATVAVAEYDVVSSDPAATTMKITVAAAGLDPDDPELRREFLEEGENQPLSDGDRQAIRGSVAEEVKAGEFPSLVFTVTGISATSGEGTATLTAELAGATSDVPVTYTITKEGDLHLISGDAVLDGAPYGIPRNGLGFCVDPIMDVHFDLALTPGEVECVGATPPPAYEVTVFDDPACAETVGFNEARDVAVRRCAGCHAESPILGATVPLVSWQDWRTDSLRNDDVPAYETAAALVHLPPSEGLSMPPQPEGELFAAPLSAEELQLFDAWIADGARDAACENDPGLTTFGPRAPAEPCDDADNYTTGAAGSRAKDFFDSNCSYCHLDSTGFYQGFPQLSLVDENGVIVSDPESGFAAVDHDIGASPVFHPFYVDDAEDRLSFWQTSVERVKDGSMPPGNSAAEDPAFAAFEAWVNAGAKAPCN